MNAEQRHLVAIPGTHLLTEDDARTLTEYYSGKGKTLDDVASGLLASMACEIRLSQQVGNRA